MYNISKETIIRTIILVVSLVNMALTYFGKNPLPFAEEEIYGFFSMLFTAVASIWAWWKNNSFSKNAIKADEFLKKLKNGETDNPQFDTQIEEDETNTIDTEVTEDVEGF
ncbi:MAG: phage holin [Clostridia bacterium]|nr:phage holin [Clostridia bacterium]